LDRPAFQLHPSVAEPLHGGAARSLQSFKGAQVHAVAGIGYPERFFKSLESAGISLIKHALADHHEYKQADIQFDDDLPVLITHKDAVKIKQLSPLPSNIFVVNVRLEPNQLLHDGIMKILDDLVPNSHEEVSQ